MPSKDEFGDAGVCAVREPRSRSRRCAANAASSPAVIARRRPRLPRVDSGRGARRGRRPSEGASHRVVPGLAGVEHQAVQEVADDPLQRPELPLEVTVADRPNAVYVPSKHERDGDKSGVSRLLPLDEELQWALGRYLRVRPTGVDTWSFLSKGKPGGRGSRERRLGGSVPPGVRGDAGTPGGHLALRTPLLHDLLAERTTVVGRTRADCAATGSETRRTTRRACTTTCTPTTRTSNNGADGTVTRSVSPGIGRPGRRSEYRFSPRRDALATPGRRPATPRVASR